MRTKCVLCSVMKKSRTTGMARLVKFEAIYFPATIFWSSHTPGGWILDERSKVLWCGAFTMLIFHHPNAISWYMSKVCDRSQRISTWSKVESMKRLVPTKGPGWLPNKGHDWVIITSFSEVVFQLSRSAHCIVDAIVIAMPCNQNPHDRSLGLCLRKFCVLRSWRGYQAANVLNGECGRT